MYITCAATILNVEIKQRNHNKTGVLSKPSKPNFRYHHLYSDVRLKPTFVAQSISHCGFTSTFRYCFLVRPTKCVERTSYISLQFSSAAFLCCSYSLFISVRSTYSSHLFVHQTTLLHYIWRSPNIYNICFKFTCFSSLLYTL